MPYDIEQKGDEMLEVRYEAKLPGNHCISVTFNAQEIPQSPIKIYVEPDIDVGRIKVTGIDSSKCKHDVWLRVSLFGQAVRTCVNMSS